MSTRPLPFFAVALAALVPLLPASGRTLAWPEGEVVVRQQCFGSRYDEDRVPQPRPAPTRSSATGAGSSGSTRKASAPMAEAEAGAAPPMALGGMVGSAASADASAPMSTSMPMPVPMEEPLAPADPMPPPAGPRADMTWGGTIHLSNDDSMSLASAQRLLWAVERGAGISTDQIRPHELLNYFSFDTTDPAPGELFAVDASAVRDGDTLTVAFAVQGATPTREPLDLTLVIDRSGSMSAEGRMDYTRRALRLMSEQLVRGDRVDVVLFDHEVCNPLENFVVGRDDMSLLTNTIDQMVPRGSTDLNAGLTEGYRLATGHRDVAGRNRRVMLLTDALLNTGTVDPHVVSEVGRHLDESGIRLTGVGVGKQFRDDVLDRLTEKGKGAYVFLGSEAVVDRLFGVGFDSLVRTIAHDVRFSLELPDSLGLERFYGEEASRDEADIQPINYYAGTSQVFLQDLAIRPGALRDSDAVIFNIRYDDPATGRPEVDRVRTTVGELLHSDGRNTVKAQALISWSDMLFARAMGGDECGAAFDDYLSRAARLSDDAEIGWVTHLISRTCDVTRPIAAATVGFKVRVDADIPIAEVRLSCDGDTQRQALASGSNIARFDARPGTCTLELGGAVAMRQTVEVPQTGADLRCVVRGGRVQCS